MEEILSKIESILFVAGEPVSFKKISDVLGLGLKETKDAVNNLKNNLIEQKRGVRILEHGNEVQMVSVSENAPILEKFIQAIKNEGLTQAGQEIVAIIGYLEPVHKHIIDEVRGVDCTNTLKNLLLKGLVDRKEDPKDHRTHIYYLHSNTLKHLGINHKNELPQFNEIKEQLEKRFIFNKDVSEESEESSLTKTEPVVSETTDNKKEEDGSAQKIVTDEIKTDPESASN